MDTAINAKTRETVNALFLEENSSYQFITEEIWFADPNSIDTFDPSKVTDVTRVEVRFRKGSSGVINRWGTEYAIAPCFFIPNRTELGINVVPESKAHKLAKNWIYNRIKNKNLKFKYSTVKRPFDYDNLLDIATAGIDLSKVGIEITVMNNKAQRADIILPFKTRDHLFGEGVVIEIQFSKQRTETTSKRSYEWAFKGYSICWVWEDDFTNIADDLIEMRDDVLVLEPMEKILQVNRDRSERDLRFAIQELSRQVDRKMKELNYPFLIGDCNLCRCGKMSMKKGKHGRFYACSQYPACRHTIPIKDYDAD